MRNLLGCCVFAAAFFPGWKSTRFLPEHTLSYGGVAFMELLFWSLVVFLAALGVVELARMGIFWLMKPVRPHSGVVVVVPQDGEECEQLIRGAMARAQWMDWGDCEILCFNQNDDPQIEAICKILERRYPNLRLCKRENLVYHITRER